MPVDTLKVDGAQRPVTEINEKSLKWYASECSNPRLKAVARRELDRRRGGLVAPKAQPSQSIVRPSEAPIAIEGNFRDPAQATAALKAAGDAYHLLSPATMVGTVPEGCAIALAVVRIDPNDPHLYSVGGGKFCLDKTHIASLANAMGASTEEIVRMDDGTHPHIRAACAKVRFRQFDGTWLHKQGSVEIDLSEPGGVDYVDMMETAKESESRDPAKQLRKARLFIWRMCESKALNRAYAALGIRRSYTKAELEKPFCVARVTFTGQSDDPEARRQFRDGIMRNFLASTDAAFGPAPATAQLPAAPPPAPLPLHNDYMQPPTYDTEGEEPPGDDDQGDEQPDPEPQPGTTVDPRNY